MPRLTTPLKMTRAKLKPRDDPGSGSDDDRLPAMGSGGSMLLQPLSDQRRRKTVPPQLDTLRPNKQPARSFASKLRCTGRKSPAAIHRRRTDPRVGQQGGSMPCTPHPPTTSITPVSTPPRERKGSDEGSLQRVSPPPRLRALGRASSDSLDSVWDERSTAYRLKGIKPGRGEWSCQDSFVCISDLGDSTVVGDGRGGRCGLYGVFDGHGSAGGDISGYCAKRIPEMLCTKGKSTSWKEALPLCCRALHREVTSTKGINAASSGTTACLVLVESNSSGPGCELTIANVGDSRAVLLSQKDGRWNIEQLSRDHKPGADGERQRILGSGGIIGPTFERSTMEVAENGGCTLPLRVWMTGDGPGLAMSRSIGDSVAHSVGVTHQAEVVHRSIGPEIGSDAVLMIASDGIFDVMENESLLLEANRLGAVYEGGRGGVASLPGAARAAVARGICRSAQIRWLEQCGISDDCCCVIVNLLN
jgi:serine/threonine protein phosphatase PrpC